MMNCYPPMFRLWLSPQLLKLTPPPANNIPCRVTDSLTVHRQSDHVSQV